MVVNQLPAVRGESVEAIAQARQPIITLVVQAGTFCECEPGLVHQMGERFLFQPAATDPFAEKADCLIARDASNPAEKIAGHLQLFQIVIGREKHLLSNIVGRVQFADEANEVPSNRLLVPTDEFGESSLRTRASLLHQVGVIDGRR